jgi:hypothetical protein
VISFCVKVFGNITKHFCNFYLIVTMLFVGTVLYTLQSYSEVDNDCLVGNKY